VLNDAGQVAFIARVEGPGVDHSNNLGLWATGPDGELRLVAREGDVFDVNDDPHVEELHTIRSSIADSSIEMLRGDFHDGRSNVFNASGELAFGLEFVGNLYGIFVANTQTEIEPVLGDYNGNGVVDAADYTVWRDGGSPDDTIAGYNLWKANFGNSGGGAGGSVPEPASLILMTIIFMMATLSANFPRLRRRRFGQNCASQKATRLISATR
jgi:hypothetical protein